MTQKMQRSVRPITADYHIFRDRDTGRAIYLSRDEMSPWDYVEFTANFVSAGLYVYLLCKFIPFMNHHWPLAGAVFLAFCFHQRWCEWRWILRTLVWGGFWGWWALLAH